MATLNDYKKHAERFGTAQVLETAVSDLSWHEVGLLSLRLQNLDKKFRVPPELRKNMIYKLAGRIDDKQLAKMAGCSVQTVRTRANNDITWMIA